MSSDSSKAVVVTILDKEYRVACTPPEEEALLASARFLDQRMREIRGSGKVIGADRVAVMAALNMAHELLNQRQNQDEAADSVGKRLRGLKDKVEIALNDSTQLEL